MSSGISAYERNGTRTLQVFGLTLAIAAAVGVVAVLALLGNGPAMQDLPADALELAGLGSGGD